MYSYQIYINNCKKWTTQFKYYCDKCDYGTFSGTENAKHLQTNSHKINICN